ncbi:MAG: OmpH family outer membrane protein [Bacteroidaceae bacterium]|nr:OmpH family outer membrane protein [Bacteroidaceae bacterium]
MNKKTILKGCAALALGLMMAQCDGNKQATTTQVTPATSEGGSGVKIAFVEIERLILNYQFCLDINQEMVKKEENVRATLNEKSKKLEAEQQDFQYKYENNAFTRARAEEEYNRLMKKAQELDELSAKLSEELAIENQQKNQQLRDSINNFLSIYNAEKQFDFIISNAGFDNLLYGNPAYDITDEIVEGLNKRYTKK